MPLGVEVKKDADDVRINREIVEAENLLKEYLYMKDFPSLIVTSANRICEDVRYLHDQVKQNKSEADQAMEDLKEENKLASEALVKTVDARIEVLHQEILKMKEDQAKFSEETDSKIEEVEKNTLWKMKDYEELLATRPNKEFVRDICKME
mmetsp:Transcript_287/g.284  ORF Transcript_287/g.284 Transcript_287/m.284 type:complete len:151 (-) Transcript_287:974-1426(-)